LAGAGDRVALWRNTPAWLGASFACSPAGSHRFATNTCFRSAEMEDILGRSEAKVWCTGPRFAASISAPSSSN
jgi:fatty-acyl-CoA synthase